MSFKDLKNIQPSYKTIHEDLVHDFYDKVLSEAIRYDRISGFFNSNSLAVAASGMSHFILNGGHMRLLCGFELNDNDLSAIKNSEKLKDIIDKKFINDIDNIKNKLVKNHVEMLGWMIANDFLEIKIAILENGTFNSMLHQKTGILYDEDENIIGFDGSVNETANGWKYNYESIKVYLGWEDMKFIKKDIIDFDRDWHNKNNAYEVIDIPNSSKEKLIKIAPKNKEDLKIVREIIESNKNKRQLFQHQKKAIESWECNEKKGILAMATGTGKTFTALKCLENTLKKDNSILTVIACPYSHLITQWAEDLKNEDVDIHGNIYDFYGDNKKWRKEMESLIFDLNIGVQFAEPNIILTTHDTFSNANFIEKIKKFNGKSMLIVDEMHHVGAKKYKKGLLDLYDYRLGLSATPIRYMDDKGTDYILKFFKGVVYEFDINQALNQINLNTGLTFLTPYNYFPVKTELTTEELEKYKEITKKIVRRFHINKNDDENNKNIQSLFSQRRAIINNAENKYIELEKILNNVEDKSHLIVFCSEKQLNNVKKILEKENFTPKHKFTQNEGTKPEKKYDGLSERQYILKYFDKGVYKAIISIHCLDEGVDVPSADKVIIMSSTTNPVESIQRRGRVLRRFPGKDIATIYDLTVIPNQEEKCIDTIIDNEKKRLIDFIDLSENKNYCYSLIEKWGIY